MYIVPCLQESDAALKRVQMRFDSFADDVEALKDVFFSTGCESHSEHPDSDQLSARSLSTVTSERKPEETVN